MPATPGTELYLKEVFSSLQGEGLLLGRRQLFVRLAHCNLACAYCDTDFAAGPSWHAETEPGRPESREHPNPAAPELLTGLIRDWQARSPVHHSLALTGGEPLLQSRALASWLPAITPILPVFLETNGTLPDALAELLPQLSWVSMDIKPAALTGEPTPWAAHAAFLEAGRMKICQVKLVVDEATTDAELIEAAHFVHRHGPEIPLILQPLTRAGRPGVVGRRLLEMQAAAGRAHPDTLVIPQLHPLLAIR